LKIYDQYDDDEHNSIPNIIIIIIDIMENTITGGAYRPRLYLYQKSSFIIMEILTNYYRYSEKKLRKKCIIAKINMISVFI